MRVAHLDSPSDPRFETMTTKTLVLLTFTALENAENRIVEAASSVGFLRVSSHRSRQCSMTSEHQRDRADSRRHPYIQACMRPHFRLARRPTDGEIGIRSTLYSPLPHLLTSWPGMYQEHWATGLKAVIPSSTGDPPTERSSVILKKSHECECGCISGLIKSCSW